VRRVAGRVNTSPDIIEDACAFAWVQFMRYQPSRERAWKAWLVTTAEREAWRPHGIAAAVVPHEFKTKEGETLTYEPVDPRTKRADDRAEAMDALEVLAAIPARRRRVMELHVAGLTYREIADVMGIGRTRVNHLINEANSAIRKERARRAGTDIPRSARATRLHELEQDPPTWLRTAIGRPSKTHGASGILASRRAALAIDDYRRLHGHNLGDEVLGCRPEDATAARAFDLARRATARVHAIRNRGLER
jgi:RNA polymerase sigma factor (sigma-70 family)